MVMANGWRAGFLALLTYSVAIAGDWPSKVEVGGKAASEARSVAEIRAEFETAQARMNEAAEKATSDAG
jgi:hypothetical protein